MSSRYTVIYCIDVTLADKYYTNKRDGKNARVVAFYSLLFASLFCRFVFRYTPVIREVSYKKVIDKGDLIGYHVF